MCLEKNTKNTAGSNGFSVSSGNSVGIGAKRSNPDAPLLWLDDESSISGAGGALEQSKKSEIEEKSKKKVF